MERKVYQCGLLMKTTEDREDAVEINLPAIHHAQLVIFQNLLDLVAGVDGPGADGIELDVGAPVAQSGARLAKFFVGEREIVVSVGVGGGQRNGLTISFHRFGQASSLIEHVAQIKIGQSVARVGFDGGAIMLFCRSVIAAIVKERAQVDMCRGVRRLQLQRLLVAGDGFELGGGIFFKRNALGE